MVGKQAHRTSRCQTAQSVSPDGLRGFDERLSASEADRQNVRSGRYNFDVRRLEKVFVRVGRRRASRVSRRCD